ncbi:hypothetical protein B0H10DRAFT_2231871 [Mycena sp. CBHHK59/15]|nr:hypothetical protein B0H10DRAFT_2244316 [Mycena sp. CBHHK59/15]KAJ6575924.1 hypothetical protein B0H10DRAFT_2236627 [Mycena sp. CBHHK59/15]KAJ6590348.1 hypothetical protein B0H10DRAFT_2233648 [Mycena sp. CBHHK59/15]KAJ6597930.1 hypothetical protein B0H10DRAFT_2231871 [Mycena sp. CBHHK59/15]
MFPSDKAILKDPERIARMPSGLLTAAKRNEKMSTQLTDAEDKEMKYWAMACRNGSQDPDVQRWLDRNRLPPRPPGYVPGSFQKGLRLRLEEKQQAAAARKASIRELVRLREAGRKSRRIIICPVAKAGVTTADPMVEAKEREAEIARNTEAKARKSRVEALVRMRQAGLSSLKRKRFV